MGFGSPGGAARTGANASAPAAAAAAATPRTPSTAPPSATAAAAAATESPFQGVMVSPPSQSAKAKPLEVCARIVRNLVRQSWAEPFAEPIDLAALPDYSEVVKTPMDLGTVLRRLGDGMYAEPLAVLADARLIWDNCFTYNSEDDRIFELGEKLRDAFIREWSVANLPMPREGLMPGPSLQPRHKSKDPKKPKQKKRKEEAGKEAAKPANAAAAEKPPDQAEAAPKVSGAPPPSAGAVSGPAPLESEGDLKRKRCEVCIRAKRKGCGTMDAVKRCLYHPNPQAASAEPAPKRAPKAANRQLSEMSKERAAREKRRLEVAKLDREQARLEAELERAECMLTVMVEAEREVMQRFEDERQSQAQPEGEVVPGPPPPPPAFELPEEAFRLARELGLPGPSLLGPRRPAAEEPVTDREARMVRATAEHLARVACDAANEVIRQT